MLRFASQSMTRPIPESDSALHAPAITDGQERVTDPFSRRERQSGLSQLRFKLQISAAKVEAFFDPSGSVVSLFWLFNKLAVW